MRRIFFLLTGIFCLHVVQAQTVLSGMPEQDCFGAIPICQTTYSTTAAYAGSGHIPNEINSTYSCLSTGEKNDVWYIFRTHSAGIISFTITPVNASDDYDWAVFNITGKSCSNIYNDPTMEVRCNYDANIGCNGVTGANGIFSGCGQTEEVLIVDDNETYLINISNYSSSQSGYTIDFSASTAQIFDYTPPRAFSDTIACTQSSVKIKYNEPIWCNTLTASGDDMALLDEQGNLQIPSSVVFTGCDSAHPYITEAELYFSHPLAGSTHYYLIARNGADGNTLSDLCGNFVAAFDTLAVYLTYNNLSVNLGSDIYLCKGDSFPILYSAVTPSSSYLWYFNNGLQPDSTPYFQATDTGTYVLIATQGAYCSATDTLSISYLPPVMINMGEDINICKGNEFPVLYAQTNASHLQWYLNQNFMASDTVYFQPSDTGMIFVQAMQEGFCMASDTIMVNYFPEEIIQLPPTKNFCENQQVTLNSGIATTGHSIWMFNNDTLSVDAPSLQTNQEGVYQYTFISIQGCVSSATTTLVKQLRPATPLIDCPVQTAKGVLISWQPPIYSEKYYLSTNNGLTYNLLNPDELSIIVPNASHSILLYADNGSCLSDTAQSSWCNQQVPTVWTAESAFIISTHEGTVSLSVYDATGRQVYCSNNYRNNWYGQELTNGIYYYVIKTSKASFQSGRFFFNR